MKSLLQFLPTSLAVYANRKMMTLLLLGFASGLPLLLTGGTPLQAWQTDAGVSKSVIGLYALLGIPYSFKFLWSPLLDRFVPPLPGRLRGSRRRGWMALAQVLLIFGIGLMGLQDPTRTWLTSLGLQDLARTWPVLAVWTQPLFIAGMAVAFLSATQDIAADAYRTDLLSEPQMGAGAAIWVTSYRLALFATGGIALQLADQLPWSQVYLLMAALMAIGLITSWFAPEPPDDGSTPQSLRAAVVEPFRAFWRQHARSAVQVAGFQVGRIWQQYAQVIWILMFILLYKLADGLAGQMSTTFLKETGFTNAELGVTRSLVGMFATIGGALIGGAAVNRLGILRSLWVFGILQGVSNLSYLGLSLLGKNYAAMLGTITIENLCGGMGTSAFLAFLMSLCDRQFSATQYALLSSLFAMGGIVAGAGAGFLAETVNWSAFFALTVLGALPSLGLLRLIEPSPSHRDDEQDGF